MSGKGKGDPPQKGGKGNLGWQNYQRQTRPTLGGPPHPSAFLWTHNWRDINPRNLSRLTNEFLRGRDASRMAEIVRQLRDNEIQWWEIRPDTQTFRAGLTPSSGYSREEIDANRRRTQADMAAADARRGQGSGKGAQVHPQPDRGRTGFGAPPPSRALWVWTCWPTQTQQ